MITKQHFLVGMPQLRCYILSFRLADNWNTTGISLMHQDLLVDRVEGFLFLLDLPAHPGKEGKV